MKRFLLSTLALFVSTSSFTTPYLKTVDNIDVNDTARVGSLQVRGTTSLNGDLGVLGDVALEGKTVEIAQDASIGGNLVVDGNVTIGGELIIDNLPIPSNIVTGTPPSTPDAVAVYADASGTVIKNSLVGVDGANIVIDGITKNGNTLSWPAFPGAAGTFLATDGAGNLVFDTPAGGGNVSSTLPFTANDYIVTTDFSSGVRSVKESVVSVDGVGNISGANSITANQFNGNLIGNVTGAASLNVLKAGDTMTGALNMASQNEVRFQDAIGGEYAGLRAPLSISSSYTVNLPTTPPAVSQILRTTAGDPNQLEWITPAAVALPVQTRVITVAQNGNDITGNGTTGSPFATIGRALTLANAISTVADPVVIEVLPGVYIEDNSGSPLAITAEGVSIVGLSALSTLVSPASVTNDLFSITATTSIKNFTVSSGPGSTARAFNCLSTPNNSYFGQLTISNFATGIRCAVAGNNYMIEQCDFFDNGVAVEINNTGVTISSAIVYGSTGGSPANTGITVTGASANVIFTSLFVRFCTTGVNASNNSMLSVSNSSFALNNNDIIHASASRGVYSGVLFEFNILASDIDVQASGAGTDIEFLSCYFRGVDTAGIPTGTAVQVTDQASARFNAGEVRDYITAYELGTPADVQSTSLTLNSTSLINNVTDIIQSGTSSLFIEGASLSASKVSINDGTNVSAAFFDQDTEGTFHIGKFFDTDTTALHIAINDGGLSADDPRIQYLSSFYNTKGLGYETLLTSPSTWFTTAPNATGFAAVTETRTNPTSLKLFSDTGTPLANPGVIRGWNLQKNGSSAELAFRYENQDAVGQPLIAPYTVMQLDGLNNQLQLPTVNTQIVFSGDTNLYRSAADTLRTDDTLIVGTLTPNRAVATGASSQLVSSTTTDTELGYLVGVTGPIQTQLNGKVSLAGDTMTGPLQLPAGSAAAPSLRFNGSTTSGLFASAGDLGFTTNGTRRFAISSAGTLTVDQFTTAGVVHNDASGNLSSSLIVNADVDPAAAIVDTKLATIATAGKVLNSATTATNLNTANAIVSRDASGNFSAGTITANLTGNVTGAASLNVLKAGDTMTGTLTLPAGLATTPSLQFTGSANTGVSAPAANTLSLSTNGTERLTISPTGTVTITGLNSAGVVHTNASGELSTSQIVNADIADSTITNAKLATISSTNTGGNIVVRDVSGNFAATMITLSGTTTNSDDVATKAYVDSVVSGGIVPKAPARVVSVSDVALSGLPTIDTVSLNANDRVLLVGQTDPIENGLWLAQVGAWTRPADFDTGNTAGQAYVLIEEGALYQGTSWICTTPTAVIDTDPIQFVQFGIADPTTAANVGAGAGQIFRNKTGVTLNLKTLAAGAFVTITNNANDITIATNGTSANTPSTLVARDGSGNFSAGTITANLTGAASLNVLKAGDTMTGTLNMAMQNEVRFQDAAGGEYVGVRAPATVAANYVLSLPTTAPLANQILTASSVTPTQLEWTSPSTAVLPESTRIIYVASNGNDITGTGSFRNPFASIARAVNLANTIATLTEPVVITVAPGTYIEDNTTGPITITTDGITITGESFTSVIIVPADVTKTLFATNFSVRFTELTVDAVSGSTASGFDFAGVDNASSLRNCLINNFAVGASLAGTSPTQQYVVDTCGFLGNTIGLQIDNVFAFLANTAIRGAAAIPFGTGIVATGAGAKIQASSPVITFCVTGLDLSNNVEFTASAGAFKFNTASIVQSGGAISILQACSFQSADVAPTVIEMDISGAGTNASLSDCLFDGRLLSLSNATALRVRNSAEVVYTGGQIFNYTTGLQAGTALDTASTILDASSVFIRQCTNDILQQGSASVIFTAGSASTSAITINDSTNVSLAYFDIVENGVLEIGPLADEDIEILHANNGFSEEPTIAYRPNFYGSQALGYINKSTSPALHLGLGNNALTVAGVTTDRTQPTLVRLVSDTASPVGTTTALRGWDMQKNGTSAELAFRYQNSDTTGQIAVPQYTVMQLDGLNNQVQLPTAATQIVFGGDTNLYRSAANTLRTDDSLAVGTLTSNRAVATGASSILVSSATTDTELGYLSGVTSSVQDQLNNRVLKAGDTMTGPLQLPAGTTAAPSLRFTGSTTSGLSANAGAVTLSTNALPRLSVSAGGTVAINQFTVAGVVHNDVSGNLSSSLIVNADVDPAAAIVDTKLATISTAGKVSNSATTATSSNVANTIVLRDASGNFSAGTITATINGASNLNVLKAGDTMTGTLILPAGTAASPSLQFTGSTNTGLSAQTANTLEVSTNGTARLSVSTTDISLLSRVIASERICLQGIQTATPVSNSTVNANTTTTILFLTPAANVNNVTIVFPGSPTNGQLFTILDGTTNNIGIINNGNGAAIVNPFTTLQPGNNMGSTAGGVMVTYIYLSATNTWYRYARG